MEHNREKFGVLLKRIIGPGLASPIKFCKQYLASYNVSRVMFVFSMLSVGCILISDLVTNLLVYSLPGMILLYLTALCIPKVFLNQAGAAGRLAHTWFLRIVSVQMYVCMCACVSTPKLLITSGMMCCDMAGQISSMAFLW